MRRRPRAQSDRYSSLRSRLPRLGIPERNYMWAPRGPLHNSVQQCHAGLDSTSRFFFRARRVGPGSTLRTGGFCPVGNSNPNFQCMVFLSRRRTQIFPDLSPAADPRFYPASFRRGFTSRVSSRESTRLCMNLVRLVLGVFGFSKDSSPQVLGTIHHVTHLPATVSDVFHARTPSYVSQNRHTYRLVSKTSAGRSTHLHFQPLHPPAWSFNPPN